MPSRGHTSNVVESVAAQARPNRVRSCRPGARDVCGAAMPNRSRRVRRLAIRRESLLQVAFSERRRLAPNESRVGKREVRPPQVQARPRPPRPERRQRAQRPHRVCRLLRGLDEIQRRSRRQPALRRKKPARKNCARSATPERQTTPSRAQGSWSRPVRVSCTSVYSFAVFQACQRQLPGGAGFCLTLVGNAPFPAKQ